MGPFSILVFFCASNIKLHMVMPITYAPLDAASRTDYWAFFKPTLASVRGPHSSYQSYALVQTHSEHQESFHNVYMCVLYCEMC